MSTRHLIAYVLLAFLVAFLAFAFWRAIYYSDRRVRRRERHARRSMVVPGANPTDDADLHR